MSESRFAVSEFVGLKLRSAARLAVALCLVLAATAAATMAQGSRGTISGSVTDPNGAAVAGATVSLFRTGQEARIPGDNVQRGDRQAVRSVTTNDQGVYQFLEIEPGVYDITVTAAGFTEANLRNANLEPNRVVRLDVALTIGGATEEVNVTASQEILDRETPTLGTTVEARRVQGLPLNGRNVLDLALGQPGVAAVTNPAGFGAGLGIRVNGARGVENNITLDGGNNNEIAVGGSTGAQPRPDAIQEFRLLTSNYEAEFGRNTGSVITVVTRGGTNDFHGNVRAFYRPTVLSAARFFDQNEASDQPRPGTKDDFRRRFERKEFGGNFGGPIYLPKFGEGRPSGALYKGQNRSFFFVDYEGRRQLIGDTRTIQNLPTAAERAGLFTRTPANATTAAVVLVDPATGLPFPIVSGGTGPGQTFQQQIPLARFSPIAQFYLNFLPIPGSTGSASVGANEVTNFDILTGRIDHLLTENQNLNFTFNYFDQAQTQPFAFGGASVPGFGAANLRTTYNYVLRHTYTISPTLVNSFLASYARNNQPGVAPQNNTSPAQIGFSANFVANQGFAGPPFISLNERGITLGNSIQGPQARVTENFQIQNSLSWVRGDHRFKFGFDGTKYKQDQLFLFINQGILTFSGNFGGNTTGNDLADFLIGTSPAALQFGANGERDYRQMAGALFAQDNWRIRENVTLSLGLRYEYNSPLTDAANRVAYYRPGAVSQRLTSGNLFFEGRPITVPAGQRAPVGLVYPGDPDPVLGGTVPDGGIARDFNNFAPRFGIAWSPGSDEGSFTRTLLGDRNTVIRAGFGVTYGAIIGDTALQQLTAPGFNGTNSFFFPGSGTLANPFAPDPFPNFAGNQGQITNPFSASGFSVFAPLTQFSRAIDPNIRTPYTYQFNVTLERAFLQNYVASIAYVGSRGKKLYALEQVNPSLGGLIPFAQNDPRRTTITPTPGNSNTRRANDDIRLGISQMVSAGNSSYDSMQTQVQRRYTNGLLFQVAYTWSKSITDSDTLRGTLDLLDRRFGRGLSSDDVPHRFVASFIYDLPFYQSGDGIARTFLGGWSIGGIYQAQSGTPFSVANPFDTTGCGGACISFADLGAPFQNVDPRRSDNRAFNADAFTRFGSGTAFPQLRRGSSGFNQFRLKNGINNFDAVLAKNTKITEGTNLELRFEAFNAFNHTQFGPGANAVNFPTGVNLNLNSPDFGRFVDARESRVIQLGARFSF